MPRPQDPPETNLDYELALAVWQRRKWLAAAVFVVAFAGAATLTMSLPNLYRATATALVERQQVSEAFVRTSVTAELETRIQTIHKQVMSRARLTEVIARLGLYPELRGLVPMDAIVERMRRDVELSLSGVEQTSGRTATIAFTVGYSGRDPVVVAEVANALVASYVAENTRSRERTAVRTAEFLKKQLDETKRELDAHQQRQGDFKVRHTGQLPDQIEVNLSALDRLNTQLRQNGEYQIRAIERRERLEYQLADARTAAPPAPPADTPAAQLRRLKQQLADLRTRFSDRYPDVIRVKTEIASLEEQIGANGTNGHPVPPPPDDAVRLTEQALEQVHSELASLKQEEQVLRRMIADYEARVENAPRRQEELQSLSRDYLTSKERYETLLRRYEEAQLAESLEQSQSVEQLRILDNAIPSAQPSAPDRFWLLLMGLVASVALGVGAMVLAEKLDTSFHTVEELRAFAMVPTLAVIRRITTPAATTWWLRGAVVALALVAALALSIAGAYYVGSNNEQIVRMTMRGRG
jgi:polysaccharide chain length determinant protein (PEP-CTERM system associated)